MKASERDPIMQPDPIIQRQFTDLRRRKQLPNFDCVGQNRAGRLLNRLGGWLEVAENNKAYRYISTMMDRFNEIQGRVEANTNDAYLVSGLIEEQQQILREMESFILKCLKQKTKEENEAKKKR